MRRILILSLLIFIQFALHAYADEYVSKVNPSYRLYYVKLSAAATDSQCMEASKNDHPGTIIFVQQFLNMGSYFLDGRKLSAKDMEEMAKAEYKRQEAFRAQRQKERDADQNSLITKIMVPLTLGWMVLGPLIALIGGAFFLKRFLKWLRITR